MRCLPWLSSVTSLFVCIYEVSRVSTSGGDIYCIGLISSLLLFLSSSTSVSLTSPFLSDVPVFLFWSCSLTYNFLFSADNCTVSHTRLHASEFLLRLISFVSYLLSSLSLFDSNWLGPLLLYMSFCYLFFIPLLVCTIFNVLLLLQWPFFFRVYQFGLEALICEMCLCCCLITLWLLGVFLFPFALSLDP